jgi:hypothetical protein
MSAGAPLEAGEKGKPEGEVLFVVAYIACP